MKTIPCLVLALCLATVACAKSREFTILGGQKIKAEVQRGMPLPAEKDGIKIEAAAFMISDGKLIFAFGFDATTTPKKVMVEEVSGAAPVLLVEDLSPTLDKNYWRGQAAPLPLSKSGVPWIWDRGDTTKIFRFTVTLPDHAQPVVLYQPAVYGGGSKKMLQQMAR